MKKTYLLLVLCLLVSGAMPVGATDSDMINGNNKIWVYRRNEKEPNKIEAVCTQVFIKKASQSTQTEQWVEGTLTIWTKVAGNVYDPATKNTYVLKPVKVNSGGDGNRKREFCNWQGADITGAPTIKVFASLFKGTSNGNGQAHRRFIVRCRKQADEKDCDDEPDDDVLEEENPPMDPPPYP